MKNLIYLKFRWVILLIFFSQITFAQSTTDNNTPSGIKFLGYNGAGLNLDFRTNNINRMQLMQTSTYSVDAYPIDNSGFLWLNLDPHFFDTDEPFSLIHLNGENQGTGPQPWGYRPWMRSGITFTDNRDFMYIGPLWSWNRSYRCCYCLG